MYQVVEFKLEIVYDEVRCAKCGHLLAKKMSFAIGQFEIKCDKCKIINKISFK